MQEIQTGNQLDLDYENDNIQWPLQNLSQSVKDNEN